MTEKQEKMVIDNIPLVHYMVKKYNCDEDCVSIGMIGLIKGVKAFDETKGYRLSSFLCKCIDNEILMSFRSNKNPPNTINIDSYYITDNIPFIDCLSDQNINIEKDLIKRDINNRLNNAIMNLNKKERDIIISIYGLYECEKTTQKELAKKYNVTQASISRKYRRILNKLKRMMESDDIDIFTE